MNINDIPYEDLVTICEGNEDTAAMLIKAYNQVQEWHSDKEYKDFKYHISTYIADYLSNFYDEGSEVTMLEQWDSNHRWIASLLDDCEEYC